MKTVSLTNPWSGAEVVITETKAKRINSCVETFSTDEEKYIAEGLDGIELLDALIENFGGARVSDIWFS